MSSKTEKIDLEYLAGKLMPILEDKFTEYEKDKFKSYKEHYLSDDFYLAVSFVNGFTKLTLLQKFLKDEEDNDYTEKVKNYLDSVAKEIKIKELKKIIDEYFWIGGGIGSTAIRREVAGILNDKKEIITDFVGFFENVVGMED